MNRRQFVGAGVAALVAAEACARSGRALTSAEAPARPRPSASQLAWQRDELAMFLHFGVNTFTDREWGDGTESPSIFAPARLDARQWARAAKSAGFRAMILTAKHHDGFCLWPTNTTEHSVAKSPFRGGQGDVVREFVDACRAEGLRPGLYLSPWDRNAGVYGDSPRYNDFYIAQLTELLTRYGTIAEVWFDGANGEGPNGRKQTYDWARTWGTVRKLQPNAVMFSDAGPDVRWIGNERGAAGQTNWSTVDPSVVQFPGASGDGVTKMLQQGDPNGSVWRPGETDVSIRPGWFYHPAEDGRVKSADNLVDLYFTSVGRNSKLLLNVPPTRDGLLSGTDMSHLTSMRAKLDAMFATNRVRRVTTERGGERFAVAKASFDKPVPVSVVDLRENIAQGQHVSSYVVEGDVGGTWRTLSEGTTIGYRKLDKCPVTTVRAVRVTIRDAVGEPRDITVAAYGP